MDEKEWDEKSKEQRLSLIAQWQEVMKIHEMDIESSTNEVAMLVEKMKLLQSRVRLSGVCLEMSRLNLIKLGVKVDL